MNQGKIVSTTYFGLAFIKPDCGGPEIWFKRSAFKADWELAIKYLPVQYDLYAGRNEAKWVAPLTDQRLPDQGQTIGPQP